jgi:hypothetical protein
VAKGKGKPKAKVKVQAKAKGKAKVAPAIAHAKAVAKAKAKSKASRSVLSQLVRSSNLLNQYSHWKVFLDGVRTLVKRHIKVRVIRPGNEWDSAEMKQVREFNLNRNRTILEDLGLLSPDPPNDKESEHSRTARLLLNKLGGSDWRGYVLAAYVNAAEDASDDVSEEELEIHISELEAVIKGFFFNRKPAKPAASRWTGVPSVAGFCAGSNTVNGRGVARPLSPSSAGRTKQKYK